MEFMVTRTSGMRDGESPCGGAVMKPFTRIDERTTKRPENISAFKGKDTSWWYGEGENHRVEHGHIKRDFQQDGWFIEIPDLDALLKFYSKHGNLIIQPSMWNPAITAIEIYDDYRE